MYVYENRTIMLDTTFNVQYLVCIFHVGYLLLSCISSYKFRRFIGNIFQNVQFIEFLKIQMDHNAN